MRWVLSAFAILGVLLGMPAQATPAVPPTERPVVSAALLETLDGLIPRLEAKRGAYASPLRPNEGRLILSLVLTEAGQPDEALAVMRSLPDEALQGHCLLLIAAGLARQRQTERARAAVTEAIERLQLALPGRIPDAGLFMLDLSPLFEELTGQTGLRILDNAEAGLGECLAAFVRSGESDWAFGVVDSLPTAELKFPVLTRLADALHRAGEDAAAGRAWLQALEATRKAEETVSGWRDSRLQTVIAGLAAVKLYNAAQSAIPLIGDRMTRILALEQVAAAMARNGDPEGASALIETLVGRFGGLLEDTQWAIALADARKDRFDRAEALVTKSDPHNPSGYEHLLDLVSLLVDAGQFDRALRLIENRSPRPGRAYTTIVVGLARAGQHDRAVELATSVDDFHTLPGPLNQVAGVIAASGDVKRAKEIVLGIGQTSARLEGIVELARSLAAAGRFEEARAIAQLPEDQLLKPVEEPTGAAERRAMLAMYRYTCLMVVAQETARIGTAQNCVAAFAAWGESLRSPDVGRYHRLLLAHLQESGLGAARTLAARGAFDEALKVARLCSSFGGDVAMPALFVIGVEAIRQRLPVTRQDRLAEQLQAIAGTPSPP